jgi:DNA-directed RNA polymerase subunit B'
MTMAAEIYLNSKFVGYTDDPKDFVMKLREQRRSALFPAGVNVSYDERAERVDVEASRGRAQRPLIVVKDGKPFLTEKHLKQLEKNEVSWSDLVKQGVIEYLDAAEEENAIVAFFENEIAQETTHLEIMPLDILGYCASLVPYGNFNQSTRLNAGAKNQKQALGLYAANYSVRMDMDVNVLQESQRPIVKTIMHDIYNYDSHPAGQNIVVAIMSYKGYNMEDSVILNRASIERGFGRSTYFRPAVAEELRYSGGLMDEVCIPDKEVKGYKSEKDYRFLEDDGIIGQEAKVKEGDVIIGKTSPPRFLSSMDDYNLATSTRRESSIGLKHGEEGIVDFVLITENEEGNKLVQVRLRDQRIPEVGDKFTSRHGQKGVVGLIVPSADMPFSASGNVPDMIFSPHGIPSRMTIAHLIEMLGGKVGSLAGRYINGTTFDAEPEERLRKDLMSMGFRENGVETMYNGQTGEEYQAKIYIGNMYYLKLKHMVANKIHSRARGPIQLLTRQPTEGRAKEGGLRLGEMEKDTFIAHGASLLLKERFDSDKTVVPVCESCGIIAIKDEHKNRTYCPLCGDNVEVNFIEISYAFKLMLDEFKSLGLYPKLELKSKY